VRQLFQNGLLQSAYWHRFAMTAHSPVGKNPEKYQVKCIGPEFKGFAQNDLFHEDPLGANHERYADGLVKALYNYMHGQGMDYPLGDFFDFLVPHTDISGKLVGKLLKKNNFDPATAPGYHYLTHQTHVAVQTTGQKTLLRIYSDSQSEDIEMTASIANFWQEQWPALQIKISNGIALETLIADLQQATGLNHQAIVSSAWYRQLRITSLWLIKM
jgi:hypothetical protein